MNPTRIVNDTRYFYFTIRRLFMNIRRLLINSRRISTKSRRIFSVWKNILINKSFPNAFLQNTKPDKRDNSF